VQLAWPPLDQLPGEHVKQEEEPAELTDSVDVSELAWEDVPAGQLLQGGFPSLFREN